MRICKSVLVSLATLSCIGAQEQNPAPQQIQPEKPKLDFAVPLLRRGLGFGPQNDPTPKEANPANPKLDFTFPRLRRPTPQKRFLRPPLNPGIVLSKNRAP